MVHTARPEERARPHFKPLQTDQVTDEYDVTDLAYLRNLHGVGRVLMGFASGHSAVGSGCVVG